MAITSVHPLYAEFIPDWEIVEDAKKGERWIKAKGEKYLPATAGMVADGMGKEGSKGQKRYEAYKLRAVFPNLVKKTVNDLLGMMHRKPAAIELPEKMEPLRDKATDEGESLQILLQKINQAQLYKGRVGVLIDVPQGDVNVLPYITTFKAENIINWDTAQREDGRDQLEFVVIDESEPKRFGFDWKQEQVYRLLDREPVTGKYRVRVVRVAASEGESSTGFAVNPGEVIPEGDDTVIIPVIGGKVTTEIPFTFIGSIDMTVEPDEIPMLPLAELSITIYRGEADYRQSLFMQAQDTLVIIGASPTEDDEEGNPREAGAGALIKVPIGGDAKYIGVNSAGLPEQREALQSDRNNSRELGASLVSAGSGGQKEAEGTIRLRVGNKTASLMSIARAGAEGLQTVLRNMATWMGLNPEEVVVTPNLDFVQDQISPKDLVDLTTAKKGGLPLSDESIHKFMKDHDMTQMDFKDEIKLIDAELEKIEEREPMPTFTPVMVDNDGNPIGQGTQNPNQTEDEE